MKIYLYLSLTTIFAGLWFLLIWKGFRADLTFSQKAASSRGSIVFYILLFAVSLSLLYMFFVSFLIPRLRLGDCFYWLMAVSLASQFICTLFPEKGKMIMAHRILTGISAILLPPMLLLIALSSSLSIWYGLLTLVAMCLMLVLLVFVLLKQNGYRYALLLQIVYYSLFFVPIILIVY